MTDRPESTVLAVATFQSILRTFAAALRPWGAILRAAADPIYPAEVLEDAAYPFPLWLGGFADNLTLDLSRLVAECEALAEVTPETRDAYHADGTARRAGRVWLQIDPKAPPLR